MYTTSKLAQESGLTNVSIRKKCQSGEILAEKVGRDWVISDQEASRFITERTTEDDREKS